MMTFRWSWIFILPLLLVRLGSSLPINDVVSDIYPRSSPPRTRRSTGSSTGKSPPTNVGAIVGGVLAGVLVTIGFFIWFSAYRKRRGEPHVEQGSEQKERPAGWLPALKSAFSPDEKEEKGADRFRDAFRDAFTRRGANRSQEAIYQPSPFPFSTDAINRPTPAAPGHTPRYPSILERGYSKTARHPQDLALVRLPSIPESLRSAPVGDRPSRRKIQIPPRALLVPPPGRQLPGLAGRVVGSSPSPRSPLW
jgi:hypothetical protein